MCYIKDASSNHSEAPHSNILEIFYTVKRLLIYRISILCIICITSRADKLLLFLFFFLLGLAPTNLVLDNVVLFSENRTMAPIYAVHDFFYSKALLTFSTFCVQQQFFDILDLFNKRHDCKNKWNEWV